MEPTESNRWLFILVLMAFVLAGRQFLVAIRSEHPRSRYLAIVYGLVVMASFLILGFFQIAL